MENPEKVLLSTAFFPPVQYFTKLVSYPQVFIEQHENYNKQSYRNRCVIYGANGPLTLSLPVKKGVTDKIPVREVELDYATNWPKIHFKAIESAYRSSPFYEYYIDAFLPFYNKKHKYLFDYNLDIIHTLLEEIGIKKEIQLTTEFQPEKHTKCIDFRNSISPKKRLRKVDPDFHPATYHQVFSEKYGFIPNLSILDLLFNEGPSTKDILERSCLE